MKHIIKSNGEEYWLNEREHFHREDNGPTYINTDGSEEWRKNGYLHRENGPAYIQVDGKESQYAYIYNKII